MPVLIADVSPPRGRVGDEITVTGTGFSSNNNQVDMISPDGSTVVNQSITSENVTTIVFTVVDGGGDLTVDFQSRLRVTNLDNVADLDERYWLVKESHANLIANKLKAQQPGPNEDPAAEQPTIAEAKDWERILATLELVKEIGSDSFPNTTCGAEGIATDATGFVTGVPRADTVQAALEMLDGASVTLPATVSQAEAEAGTATANRLWTAQRVSQAIAALAGAGGMTVLDVQNQASGTSLSFSVPANTLATDGQMLLVLAWGTSTSGGNNMEVNLGTSAVYSQNPNTGGQDFFIVSVIERTGAATQENSTAGFTPGLVNEHSSTTETLGGALTIEVTADAGTPSIRRMVTMRIG